MTWGKSLLLTIPLALSGILVVASPASASTWTDDLRTDWTSVSAGDNHTCAIRAGKLYCWGDNTYGQVGNGGDSRQDVPDDIGSSSDWTSVSAGSAHTCGIRAKKLYCWGSDGNGRLGNGGDGSSDTPDQVGTSADWKLVSAGGAHTCGIRAIGSAGVLYCWGYGGNGQTGYGGTGSPTSPARVTQVYDWKSVSAGGRHTCGTRGAGYLYCWGLGSSGQTGYGGTGSPKTPARITSASDWKSVSAGGSHTCGTRGTGYLYCWGLGSSGQTGYGGTGSPKTPARVTTANNWKIVSAGVTNTCATHGTGNLYCWGDNTYGQVLDGSTTTRFLSPYRLFRTFGDFRGTDAGGRHSCGIRGTGVHSCWGLGVPGSTPVRTYPTPGTAFPASVPGFENMSYWKLTVPVDSSGGTSGTAAEVRQPELATFKDPDYFHASSDNEKVYFRARVDGATTDNSSNPRSELREMRSNGTTNAAWSNATSTHIMTIRQAITHVPDARPWVVAGQIHDGADDVLQIRLEGSRLFVVVMDGSTKVADQTLTDTYQLGDMFDAEIRADPSGLRVTYNGSTKTTVPRIASSATWYFKAGCYTQSNTSVPNEPDDAYGEVLIDSVTVTPITN